MRKLIVALSLAACLNIGCMEAFDAADVILNPMGGVGGPTMFDFVEAGEALHNYQPRAERDPEYEKWCDEHGGRFMNGVCIDWAEEPVAEKPLAINELEKWCIENDGVYVDGTCRTKE